MLESRDRSQRTEDELWREEDLLLNTNNNIGVLAAWNVGQQTEDHIGLGIPGILLKQTNNG